MISSKIAEIACTYKMPTWEIPFDIDEHSKNIMS
jgi:hypothetical protein